MEVVSIERRRIRSSNVNQAIGYLFDSVSRRHGLSHIALADGRGIALVSRGAAEECDSLAACAPLIARTVERSARDRVMETLTSYLPSASAERLTVRKFETGGETLFLCAVGDAGATKDVAIGHALTAARRILA